MMFVTESNLFDKSEMMKMDLYPPATHRTDECDIPYSMTGQDFKDLCILNLDEIKDRILRQYEEEVEACEMANPNSEMNPINEIMAEGILLALIRAYIAENMVHTIFHMRLFKFEELVSDEFAMDFIFDEMKAGGQSRKLKGMAS